MSIIPEDERIDDERGENYHIEPDVYVICCENEDAPADNEITEPDRIADWCPLEDAK